MQSPVTITVRMRDFTVFLILSRDCLWLYENIFFLTYRHYLKEKKMQTVLYYHALICYFYFYRSGHKSTQLRFHVTNVFANT